MTLSILVVDDDETIRGTMVEFFESLGHTTRAVATATAARRAVAEHSPDVALVDIRLPDANGLVLFEAMRADDPEVGIIFLTAHADVPTAVTAMRLGAIDFLEKPVDLDALEAAVLRAAELGRMRRELALRRARDVHGTVDEPSPVAPGLERLIALAARNDDAPVLILGETGTGKGFVARRIHELSPRRDSPFIEVNCASLSATFFESELFGHEKGAFTDAKQAKRGLIEVAARGTVFLDEIAELASEVQPKLLKVIEDHTFRRLGGTTELQSSARMLVATNVPLGEAVAERRFRADLFYRLQVLTIVVPPLRERVDEIASLARALLPRSAVLSDDASRALLAYHWPGNIRELRNALWRASILADGAPITSEHLALAPSSSGVPAPPPPHAPTLADAERRTIAEALRATGGNKRQAAQLLGIARSTLTEKVRKLGLP